MNLSEGDAEVIRIKQATKTGYVEMAVGGVVDLDFPGSKTRRGRVIDSGEVSPAITASTIPYRIEKV